MTLYSDAIKADSPVAYWRLGEPSGTNAADEMGVNAGTYVNSPTMAQTDTIANDTDTAVLFDGLTQYVTVPSHASLNATTALTLEAWCKPTSLGAGTMKPIILKSFTSHNPPYYQYGLLIHATSTIIGFYGSIGGAFTGFDFTNTGWTYDVWHHFVARYDGATFKVYLNGVEKGSNAVGSPLDTYATPINICAYENLPRNSTYCLGATVDEVAVYASALSPRRIVDHYQIGVGLAPTWTRRAGTSFG